MRGAVYWFPMADFLPLESRAYPPYLPEDRQALREFLGARGLQWESDIEYSVACLAEGRIVGTGSLSGRVIKCLAVDEGLRGEGVAAMATALIVAS